MKELRVLAFIVVAVMLFVISIMVFGNLYIKYQCESYSNITGKNTKYNNFDICYIETEYGWQRWDEYQMRSVASEGLQELKR